MKSVLSIILSASFFVAAAAWSHSESAEKEKHEHKPSGAHDDEHKGKNHSHDDESEHAHDDGESHTEKTEEHHEETSNQVGPEKGVLEASEQLGIKLSPEALKNFELKTEKVIGSGPWIMPASSRFQSGEEANLYRLRGGFFKRIEFTLVKRTANQITVSSSELKAGDEIVSSGLGFLRITEVAAFGGAPEGHSH